MRVRFGFAMRRYIFALTLAGAAFVSLPQVQAATSATLSLGEVTTPKSRTQDVKPRFIRVLKAEMDGLTGKLAKRRPAYVLSASLTRLDTRKSDAGSLTQCAVSLALRRQNSQTLYAIARGRATVKDGSGAPARSERSRENEQLAMEAAVRSALSRVKKAIP